MDEKLLSRGQAAGAILVCISYFMPWASIMTPLGSVELRGLYVDYAWIILVLAAAHLLIQFARGNNVALGLSDASLKQIDLAWQIIPLAFVGFFAWYGASFLAHTMASHDINFLGVSVSSFIRAGLDFGFWIGVIGTVLVVTTVGLRAERLAPFIVAAAAIGATAIVLAVGLPSLGITDRPSANTLAPAADSSASTSPNVLAVEPAFNATPYIQVGKISGTQIPKNIEASRFNDSIIISVTFKNVTSKTVTGLEGRISILDGFGKERYGFGYRDDDKIGPGETSSADYKFEGNQFIEDDPYHKMMPMIEGGTAHYTATVTRIAFSDGSVLPK